MQVLLPGILATNFWNESHKCGNMWEMNMRIRESENRCLGLLRLCGNFLFWGGVTWSDALRPAQTAPLWISDCHIFLHIRDAKHRIPNIKGQNGAISCWPSVVTLLYHHPLRGFIASGTSCGNSSKSSSCLALCWLGLRITAVAMVPRASHVCNSDTRPSQETFFNLLISNFSEVSILSSCPSLLQLSSFIFRYPFRRASGRRSPPFSSEAKVFPLSAAIVRCSWLRFPMHTACGPVGLPTAIIREYVRGLSHAQCLQAFRCSR
jgi:hypothetical protein